MTDPITAAARASAKSLTADYGPDLVADVEAALAARGAVLRPNRYTLDPVSLGSLIVSITALAWTIYADLRQRTPEPAPEVVARKVRVELRNHGDADQEGADRVIEIVVAEVIRVTSAPR